MEHHEATSSLISIDKVVGTNVYNANGDSLGEIHDIMIDKLSGKVAYAVLSFGGFFELGEQYHPLPWQTLSYDPHLGGYAINMTKEQLEGAPAYTTDTEPPWGDRAYEKRIHQHYGTTPYWGDVT